MELSIFYVPETETGSDVGRRSKTTMHISFPGSQVYITRNIICVIYVLLALLLFLLLSI